MKMIRYKFGLSFEETYGYSQACRAGDTLYVSGQVPIDDAGNIVGKNDFDIQVRAVYQKIDRVLEHFGATRNDIVDETIFIVDPHKHWEAMQRLHTEYFGATHPASTYIGVTALAIPGISIEIKVTVWLGK